MINKKYFFLIVILLLFLVIASMYFVKFIVPDLTNINKTIDNLIEKQNSIGEKQNNIIKKNSNKTNIAINKLEQTLYTIENLQKQIDQIKKIQKNDRITFDHSHLDFNFSNPNNKSHANVLKNVTKNYKFRLYKSVKFYNNNFIIVGGYPENKLKNQGKGVIITSSQNGNLWTLKKSNTDNLFRDIIYSKKLKLYVAVGDFGSITISKDLMNWEPVEAPNDSQICAIAYGNETFITSGNFGTIHKSKDGITWETLSRDQTNLYNGDLYKIGFGNNMFFTLGYDGRLYTT